MRRLRYFYGSTLVAGSSFDFHGKPVAILKGRLIALLMLLAYSQAAKFSLAAWYVVVAVLVALMPWLLWRSLRFRLANTSYRGIRFRFDGTLRDAYLTFIPLIALVIGPTIVLTILSGTLEPSESLRREALVGYLLAAAAGLVFAPWFFFRLRAYRQRHSRLGTSPFAFDATVGGAYVLSLKLVGLFIGIAIAGALIGVVAGTSVWLVLARSRTLAPFIVGGAAFYATLLGITSIASALIQRFVWNGTTLADARFATDVSAWRLLMIDATNAILCIATLGFFWPFANIRRTRYRVGSMTWAGDPDAVTAAATHRLGATGDEAADLFGLDLAL